MGLRAFEPVRQRALESVEPLIAAMSAKARLIPGRLLPAADLVTVAEELPTPVDNRARPRGSVSAGPVLCAPSRVRRSVDSQASPVEKSISDAGPPTSRARSRARGGRRVIRVRT